MNDRSFQCVASLQKLDRRAPRSGLTALTALTAIRILFFTSSYFLSQKKR
jgi:hypothetical protein